MNAGRAFRGRSSPRGFVRAEGHVAESFAAQTALACWSTIASISRCRAAAASALLWWTVLWWARR
ncbi:hypothetical protein [Streptomyces anulatus]|uniref:hypothetical protein n=1 Tax=Streptomyces anulatus TaxID=1892 RepID=UPI003868354B